MHKLFGTKHIILIVLSIALVVGFYFLTKKWKFKTKCKVLLSIAIACEIIKTLTYIVLNESKYGGILPKSDLPFQLCSIQLIFIAIVVFSKNEKMKRVLLAFMMPSCLFGGIAAILIATNSSLNVWIITIQYFLYHISLCVFALHLFTNKEFKWNIKDYVSSLIFVVCLLFFAIYMNSMMFDGTSTVNYMYVVDPPQKNLPFLNEDSGWIVYMLRYSLLVIVCMSLAYIKPIITSIKNLFTKKSIETTSNESKN